MTDILGYTPAEMLDADFRYADIIHPDDLKTVVDEINWYIKYRATPLSNPIACVCILVNTVGFTILRT
ncbi:PAS domain-containing protein [Chromatium okenii]|uniref:PAS domain-containing protein n=1 Tax=Chromatium okenii TaxID=61644 RepID=UPI0011B03710|nr:PAS domain-containing protein [Chromatium okenii]